MPNYRFAALNLFKVYTMLKFVYLTVAHLVIVLVSHVDLERVHTCKKEKQHTEENMSNGTETVLKKFKDGYKNGESMVCYDVTAYLSP